VGTATTTEGEIALITALGGLQVGRGLTADQMKLLSHDQRGSSKRSTRKNLAVGAVADPDTFGVNGCFELDFPAMAATRDIHQFLLLKSQTQADALFTSCTSILPQRDLLAASRIRCPSVENVGLTLGWRADVKAHRTKPVLLVEGPRRPIFLVGKKLKATWREFTRFLQQSRPDTAALIAWSDVHSIDFGSVNRKNADDAIPMHGTAVTGPAPTRHLD
jgi:hypothetical protein